MTTQYYYVERPYAGVFAIVEPEILDMMKHPTQDSGDLFIRPMHYEENWDNTIHHEKRADKDYLSVCDKDDVEEFLAW